MSFKDQWNAAGEAEDDFDPPDGAYHVEIVDGRAWVTQDGREFAKVILQITKGEHKGRRFDHFMNFNNDVGFKRARTNLTMYGAPVEQVEDLDDVHNLITELAGVSAEVKVKHNSGYLNVDVYRAKTNASDIPGQDPLPVNAGNGAEPDDDIPF